MLEYRQKRIKECYLLSYLNPEEFSGGNINNNVNDDRWLISVFFHLMNNENIDIQSESTRV